MTYLKKSKNERILDLYTRLTNGKIIHKGQAAIDYAVDERTIQRDINDIRHYLETQSTTLPNTVIYDRKKNGYRLQEIPEPKFTNSQILALCKILLDSRSLLKTEMTSLLKSLVTNCVPQENQKAIRELIKNELFHYIEPRHQTSFMDTLWELGQAIRQHVYVELIYQRGHDKTLVHRRVKPVSLLFSEYYFYLTAYIDDQTIQKDFDVPFDYFPTIYRVDRIKKLNFTKDTFRIEHAHRFDEGEYRKRIQFMTGGALRKVLFRYTGSDIEPILDRLPTAVIRAENTEGYLIEAEVFGNCIDRWLLSQGEYVEILKDEKC